MPGRYWTTPDPDDERGAIVWDEDPEENPDASPVGRGTIPSSYSSYDEFGQDLEDGKDPKLDNYQPLGGDGEGDGDSAGTPDPAAGSPGEGDGSTPTDPGGEGEGQGDPTEGDDGEASAGSTGDVGGVEEGDYGDEGEDEDEPDEGTGRKYETVVYGERTRVRFDEYADDNAAAADDARAAADDAADRADELDELARQAREHLDRLDELASSLLAELNEMLASDPLANPSAQDQVEDNRLQTQTVADPVRPFSGSYLRRETDARVPCAWGDFAIERIYDNQIYTMGLLGPKWRLNLEESVRRFASGRVLRVLDDGTAVVYEPDPAHPGGPWLSPDGWNDILERRGAGWRVTDGEGGQRFFDAAGRLTEIRDRYGNRAVLAYTDGRLSQVVDPCGREFILAHDAGGRLLSLTDPAGGVTTYEYADGRLAAVHPPPAAPGAPGPSRGYRYADGPDPRMRHNLAAVLDHDGAELIRNRFGEPGEAFNRVVRQDLDGGTWRLDHLPFMGAAVRRLQITNPLGHVTVHDFDADGRERVREAWTAGLQPGAPARYVRTFAYGATGLVTAATTPGGGVVELAYDEGNPDFLARTNLLAVRRRPAAGAPDADSPVVRYTYGAFNQPVRIVDERGQVTDLTLDARGSVVRCEMPARTLADGSTARPTIRWEYDGRGQPVRRVAPDGQVVEYTHYTTSGRRGLLRRLVTDPAGVNAAREWSLDLMGRCVLERAPGVSPIEHRYDGRGRPTALVRNGQVLRQWTYDRHDRVTSVAEHRLEPDGAAASPEWAERRLEYDLHGRPAVTRVLAGPAVLEEVRATHDVLGRVVRVQGPGTRDAELSYDEQGRTLALVLAPGTAEESRWRYEFDADGNTAVAISPRGHRTVRRFDGLGRLLESTDPAGHRELFGYDAGGNLLRVERRSPEGTTCRLEERTVDADGAVTERRLARLDAAGQVLGWASEQFHRDAVGRVVRHVAANGAAATAEFDLAGRLVRAADPLGNVQQYTFDAGGRLRQALREETLAGGGVARVAYQLTWNADGRPTRLTDSAGRRQQFHHDALGLLRRVTLPDGTERIAEYDALRRLTAIAVRHPAGNVTWTERRRYGADGQVSELEDAAGRVTRIQRDDLGRIRRIEDPSGRLLAGYAYDAAGNVVETRDARGVQVTQAYDVLDRLAAREIVRPAGVLGARKESFAYDANGQLAVAGNEFAEARFTHDSLGALTRTAVNGREALRRHRPDGSLAGVLYPCGLDLAVTVDPLGRLRRVEATTPAGGAFPGQPLSGTVAEIDYEGRRCPVRVAAGNGVETRWTYDLLGRPLALETRQGTRRLRREAELRDPLDRVILRAEEGGPAHRFGREPRGMLAATEPLPAFGDLDPLAALVPRSATVPSPVAADAAVEFTRRLAAAGAPVEKIEYDAAANRVRERTAAGTVDHAVNERDEVTGVAGAPLQWDAAGNLADDGSREYAYDAANRLCRVVAKATGQVVYEADYDAVGRVIRTREDGEERLWYYDGGSVIERSPAQQPADLALVWGPGQDELLMLAKGGQNRFAHPDLHGNTALLTDAAGAPGERYAYDPWGGRRVTGAAGQRLDRSAVGNPFGYLGRPHLEGTPLLDVRARAYHAGLGRFISRDPSGYADGPNLYRFCRNDPLTFLDHSGRDSDGSEGSFDWLWSLLLAEDGDAGEQVLGAVHAVGGGFETATGFGVIKASLAVGVVAGWTGVGAVVAVVGVAAGGGVMLHGVDQMQSGGRQAASGKQTDSGFSTLLQSVGGVSKDNANLVDSGVGLVGSVGGGAATLAMKLHVVARKFPELASGLSKWQLFVRWEKGQRALNKADFEALGGTATNGLAIERLLAAGKNAAGEAYTLTTGPLARFFLSIKLYFTTGVTPAGNVVAGLIGGGGNVACRK